MSEHVTAVGVDRDVRPERSLGRWPLDKPFPAVLYDADLMSVLARGHSAFYRLKKSGALKAFEVRPQLPGNTQYSGRLVERWVRGELEDSRYFATARLRQIPQPGTARRGPGRPRKPRPVVNPAGSEE